MNISSLKWNIKQLWSVTNRHQRYQHVLKYVRVNDISYVRNNTPTRVGLRTLRDIHLYFNRNQGFVKAILSTKYTHTYTRLYSITREIATVPIGTI